MTTFLEALDAVRHARAWAAAAPRYTGEHYFGSEEAEPLIFGVFGDSLGCGVGASGVHHSVAGVVALKMAESRRVICRIEAISGAQAPALALQRVNGDEELVGVSIGTNDLLHGASQRRLELALGAFLERVRHARRVIVFGPGNVASLDIFPAALKPLLKKRMTQWEAAMAGVAARFPNAAYLGPSHSELALSRADFAADGFHPGDLGQRRIGELVHQLLY